MFRVVAGYSVLVLSTCLAGCGGSSGPKLTHVSGKVTLSGTPVGYGSIEFVPDKARGGNGPAGTAEIINGEYSTKTPNGRGVIEGAHLVRITGYKEKPAATSTDENVPTTGAEPLFNGYTVSVEKLPAEMNFDLPEAARGFDLYKAADTRRRANEP